MTEFREELKPNDRVQGDHVVDRQTIINKEFEDANLVKERYFSGLTDEVNRILSGEPDYDTGYLKVSSGAEYTLTHSLKRVPSRIQAFFCPNESPEFVREDVYLEQGIQFSRLTDTSFKLTMPSNFADGGTSGYIRIMVWR